MSTSLSAPTVPLRQDAEVIGLVAVAHATSHFSHLLVASLFPWLKQEFHLSYAELGLLMSIFFVVSGIGQALAGFVVDRVGPQTVLHAGLSLIGLAALGLAASPNYPALAASAALAGLGNSVFHPVDFTLLNRKVSSGRLGHAYSAHGICGNLGWALAPSLLVPIAIATTWRTALVCAALLVFAVLLLVWGRREVLAVAVGGHAAAGHDGRAAGGSLDFLRIPAVWMCFAFFLASAVTLGGVQSFASEAARQLHDVPLSLAAACLSIYMVASACGMAVGGFMVKDPARCEQVIGTGFGAAAVVSLSVALLPLPPLAVPVMFALMGFSAGLAGPSRDLLIKRSAPDNATGRVYGVVYSGLDTGNALAPLIFGALMDMHQPAMVWLGIALFQCLLIVNAFSVRKVRRTAVARA